jgi:tetratricopeptide (TPR) repeat protein
MQNAKLLISVLFITGLIITGYQCSSTELTSARLYIQQKNYDKALEVLQQDVAKNPQSDEGYFLMGVVYGELDDMKKLVESFDKSLSISDNYAKEISEYRASYWASYFNRGYNNYQRSTKTDDGDSAKIFMDRAIESYKTAILLEPDSADNYRNMAFAYLSTGDYTEAIDPLKKLIELDKSEDGYQYLGEIYYSMGLNKMSEYRNSNNTQDSLDAMKHYDNAISVLSEGKENYPFNAEITSTLTLAYIGSGRINEAMEEAKIAVETDPNNRDNHYNYGVLLLNAESYEEAESQFLQALEIDPEHENSIYNLAVTYVRWGTEMNKQAEDDGIISEDYKEKYKKALPYLEDVVKMDENNAELWELLGKVYTVLGMTTEAEKAFNEADALRN